MNHLAGLRWNLARTCTATPARSQRAVFDGLFVDVRLDVAARGVQQRGFLGHRDLGGHRGRLQVEIHHPRRVQLDARSTAGDPESGRLRRDAVVADRQKRELVVALLVGAGSARQASFRVLGSHPRARHDCPARILDMSLQRTRNRLSAQRHGYK